MSFHVMYLDRATGLTEGAQGLSAKNAALLLWEKAPFSNVHPHAKSRLHYAYLIWLIKRAVNKYAPEHIRAMQKEHKRHHHRRTPHGVTVQVMRMP